MHRSDIPLASAERLAARAPQTDDERERAFAAAWHQRNVVSVDLDQPLNHDLIQAVTRYAEARWGKRRPDKRKGRAE